MIFFIEINSGSIYNQMMLKKRRQQFFLGLGLLISVVFTAQSVFPQPASAVNGQIEALKAELAKNPESLAAHYELARQYYNIQRSNEAQQHFLAVIGIDPQNADAYAYLGHIYLNQNKSSEAIAFFQQALKWQPDNQLALTGLKQIQSRQQLISQLQETQTRIAQEKWNDAYRQLLEIPMQAKKLPEFRELRQQVAQHFYEQGNLYYRSEDWVTAQTFFTQLQELLPDYLDAPQKMQLIEEKLGSQNKLDDLYLSGNQAFQRQNWSEALRYFEKILKIDRTYKDTQRKWQAAFAARDAVIAATETSPEESAVPETTPESTRTIAPPQTDSIEFAARSADTLQNAKPPAVPFYRKLSGSKFYWLGLLLVVVFGFLFRQIFRGHDKRVRQKTRPEAASTNGKTEQINTGSVADSAATEPMTLPPTTKTNQLPALPYKRFELKQQIARFDQVYVFLAKDRRLNRQVLIDRISLNGNGNVNAKQIIAGVQTAANLNHPNIVRVEDVFFQDDVVFIVMEHVPGIPLTEMLTGRKPGDLLKSVQIIRACCLALSYAHRHEVFHANLHPFYVKILSEDTIKLGGFELATFRSTLPKENANQFSDFVGYQSPEQLRNGQTDARSDIFSLGIIFYELLTLNNPFQGESNAVVVFNILEGNPIPPREINPDVPQNLNRMVMKMLAKNRGDRYFNAFDIALELKKYL